MGSVGIFFGNFFLGDLGERVLQEGSYIKKGPSPFFGNLFEILSLLFNKSCGLIGGILTFFGGSNFLFWTMGENFTGGSF